MRVIGFIFNTIFLLIMLSVAGLFMLPYLPFDHGIELRIVESGSMEPAIMTGSLIMVRPHDAYNVGDVIMFDSPQTRVPTTHRILDITEEKGRTQFITKGDANEEADPGVVYESQIFGTVAFALPRAGFVLDFARQPLGFIFLIVLPALLIVFGEIEKIWREIRARRKGSDDNESDGVLLQEEVLQPVAQEVVRKAPRRSMMDIATPVRVLRLPTLDLRGMTPYKASSQGKRRMFTRHVATLSTIVFSILVFSSSFLGSTVSYFNDTEFSIDNFLGAISLDVAAVPDGEVYNFLGDAIDDLDGAVVVTVSPESGSAAVHYDIVTNIVGSSTPLCSAVVADAAAPVSYIGALPLMTASDVTFEAPWEIAFSLPDESGLASADSCSVEVVLTAWHFDEALGEGYYDSEIVPLTFTYAQVVSATPPNVASDGSISDGAVTKEANEGSNSGTQNGSEQNAPDQEVVEEQGGGSESGGGQDAGVGNEQTNNEGEQENDVVDPPTTGGEQGGGSGAPNTDEAGSISGIGPGVLSVQLEVQPQVADKTDVTDTEESVDEEEIEEDAQEEVAEEVAESEEVVESEEEEVEEVGGSEDAVE